MKLHVNYETRENIKKFAYIIGCSVLDSPKVFFQMMTDLCTKGDLYSLLSNIPKKAESRKCYVVIDIEEVCQKIDEMFKFDTSGGSKYKSNATYHKFLRAFGFVVNNTELSKIYRLYRIEEDIEGARALLKDQLEKAFNEDSIC